MTTDLIRLLINNVGSARHWIGLRVLGRQGRDIVGARVGIVRANALTLWRRVRADGSYVRQRSESACRPR